MLLLLAIVFGLLFVSLGLYERGKSSTHAQLHVKQPDDTER